MPGPEIESDYLYYALKISVPAIRALGSGATFTEVSKSVVEAFSIPLPPLPEQRRIAALLTEQMAAVGRARAALQSQLSLVEELPASLLARAFSGDL